MSFHDGFARWSYATGGGIRTQQCRATEKVKVSTTVTESPLTESANWLDLDLVDLDAVPEPLDKVKECQFFLGLAEHELDPQRFRWLTSAFFGAAYSFFEIAALNAHQRFFHPDTGEPLKDEDTLKFLRQYVVVKQDNKRPSFVKTAGRHHITRKLYDLRRTNTHYEPLSIMRTTDDLPGGFHFGILTGTGTPALAFCREVMVLIDRVATELQENL